MRSVLLLVAASLCAQSPKHGLGRAPSVEDLRTVGIAVAPDGTGLPPGRGTAAQGREVYERRCQRCHGAKGEGGDSVAIVGGQGTLKTPKPLKTVGSFWPYATTLWDYINRSMPFNQPGLLTHDHVYAVTAFVLELNGLVKPDDVLDAKSLPRVEMPNHDGFVKDPRPDVGTRSKKK